ncbi:MAG: NAD(P)-binding domain-containing protein, partial [Propionibacteriaceae bacterium]|nr:NAD(P)-binding domain-containing protein [Propionibacteriaceae bacterium]
MKVSFIGFGAVGAGYGVKFLDVPGVELRVVAAGVRAERLMRDGVVVGGERFEVPVVTPDEPMEPADVVFVAVKYSGLAQAIEDIRGHVGQGTVIVSLMNGVTSEQTLAQAFPQARVLYAFTVQIDTNRVDNRVEYTTLGRIVFGEALNEAPYSDAVRLVDELLAGVGIEGE